MAWVDYGYYAGTFAGNEIGEADFPGLEARSEEFVAFLSGGAAEAQKNEDCVKKAVCAVAEALRDRRQGGALTEERVGDWQRAYAQAPSRSEHKALLDAARPYLEPAGLLRTVTWA